MKGWCVASGLVALGLFAVVVGPARADRTPSTRTSGQRSSWPKSDITVPYTTSGASAFMTTGSVAPRIYNSPIVDDPKNPQARPVFNLIFYGSVQAFGSKSNGATSSPTPPLRR
jgi:hypothetical protein